LTKRTDLRAEDLFFGRLVKAGFGSRRELENEWSLAEAIRAHQQLDLAAEADRIMHQETKPKNIR
jgi:hypothetical protein